MEEIWKDIICQDIRIGWYEVSNLGRIRYKNTKRIMSPFDTKGYMRIGLMTDERGQQKFPVHRLVATAFIDGRTEDRRFVNHIDGDKHNNTVSNLEWVTASENTTHAIRTGLLQVVKGEDNGATSLTNEQVHEICKVLKENLGCIKSSIEVLKSKGINVTAGLLMHIKSKSTWSFISDEYFDDKFFDQYGITPAIVCLISQTLAWNDGDTVYCHKHLQSMNINISIDCIQLIRDKYIWKRISDKYFITEEFDETFKLYHVIYIVKNIVSGYMYITPRITEVVHYIDHVSEYRQPFIYTKLFNMEKHFGKFEIQYIKI